MKREKIERNLLEKEAANFVKKRKEENEQKKLFSLNERQAHFEANYKKK